jgi:hypothetical protein
MGCGGGGSGGPTPMRSSERGRTRAPVRPPVLTPEEEDRLIYDNYDNLVCCASAAGIGLVVMLFTWGSWWALISVFLLLVSALNLFHAARNVWLRRRRRLAGGGPRIPTRTP